MKEVAHGVDEYKTWIPPLKRLREAVGVELHVLSRIRRCPRKMAATEPEGESLSVTMGTSRRDL
jgi:hypothetical protein